MWTSIRPEQSVRGLQMMAQAPPVGAYERMRAASRQRHTVGRL